MFPSWSRCCRCCQIPGARRDGGTGFAAVFTVFIAAACAGSISYAAAAQWIADLPKDLLRRIGIGPVTPAISTLRRLVLAVDADLLDAVLSAWVATRAAAQQPGQPQGPRRGQRSLIAVDGKSLRGAIGADGRRWAL